MLTKFSDRLSHIWHIVSSIALVVMMLVVVADVALRFLFNLPVRGAYDIVSVCLLVMVFFGIAPVIYRGKEIVIDLVDTTLPPTALRALRTIATCMAICVLMFIAWSMFGPTLDAWRYGDRSLELNLPVWMFWAAAFVGLAGVIWASVAALWLFVRHPQASLDQESGEKS